MATPVNFLAGIELKLNFPISGTFVIEFNNNLCHKIIYNILKSLYKMNVDILFDNNIEWNEQKIGVLDEVVKVMYSNNPQHILMANDILMKLSDDPEFWLKTDAIMTKSQVKNTKFIVLKNLEDTIHVSQNFSTIRPAMAKNNPLELEFS
jgi:hypothetical protein